MGFNDIITKLFGNKAQRDLKETSPYVDLISKASTNIVTLDNDGLRQKSVEIKEKVQNSVNDEKLKIEELKANIEDLELDEEKKNTQK